MNDETKVNLSEHGGTFVLNDRGERERVGDTPVTEAKVNGAPPRPGDPPEVAPEEPKPVRSRRNSGDTPVGDATQ